MPEFIPGLALNEAFYWQAVRPILDTHFPGLAYSAALIGSGSDVLGFDTPTSCDHEWGPRLTIFLAPENFAINYPPVHEMLRQELPVQFLGYSTHFSSPDPQDQGVRLRTEKAHGPVDHHVYFDTIRNFWNRALGVEPFDQPEAADWLTFSEQALLTVTAGKVFHDGLGIEDARRRFAYYPKDVWRYLLACQWELIAEEEAFIGRTASIKDELGSKIITARIAERLMRLCFLMEKQYAPYSKWFGTAFQHLACYSEIGPLLEGAAAANTYTEREPFLAQAYTLAAEMHNTLDITAPLETRTRTYSGWHALRRGISELSLDDPANTRPFQCIYASRFAEAILETIQDPDVRAFMPSKGSASQFLVESSGALMDKSFRRSLKDDLTTKE